MRMAQSTHLSMSKKRSIQPHPLEVLCNRSLREFSFDWILHCTVRVFNMDTHLDMDTWAWTDMDIDMDMDTSGNQWNRFCTWTPAMIERAMSGQR